MTTTCVLCRLARWCADIFSANKWLQKKWEGERLKPLRAVQWMRVSQLEFVFLCSHFMNHSNVCVTECKCVCQYLCLVCSTILFPFIGACGVCGKMSVAHFHTPIVSQWACRCGGYRSWSGFHHIIHCCCWSREMKPCVEESKEEN